MQALSLNSCTFPDGLDRRPQLHSLRQLDLSWTQHPECHKLLRAAGPHVTHLTLRVHPEPWILTSSYLPLAGAGSGLLSVRLAWPLVGSCHVGPSLKTSGPHAAGLCMHGLK